MDYADVLRDKLQERVPASRETAGGTYIPCGKTQMRPLWNEETNQERIGRHCQSDWRTIMTQQQLIDAIKLALIWAENPVARAILEQALAEAEE